MTDFRRSIRVIVGDILIEQHKKGRRFDELGYFIIENNKERSLGLLFFGQKRSSLIRKLKKRGLVVLDSNEYPIKFNKKERTSGFFSKALIIDVRIPTLGMDLN